ncbi:uncharacterized protein LOC116351234 [Contarinia nasturtii]|uniref:uncharacterized protein LOC116351234 n=1 Tax=Contarinia nasturtii TaxID=265458 RepID=UPI0012D44FC5|nr:uncharacterized protein LOC116351234 [Contarinia nasturtii]
MINRSMRPVHGNQGLLVANQPNDDFAHEETHTENTVGDEIANLFDNNAAGINQVEEMFEEDTENMNKGHDLEGSKNDGLALITAHVEENINNDEHIATNEIEITEPNSYGNGPKSDCFNPIETETFLIDKTDLANDRSNIVETEENGPENIVGNECANTVDNNAVGVNQIDEILEATTKNLNEGGGIACTKNDGLTLIATNGEKNRVHLAMSPPIDTPDTKRRSKRIAVPVERYNYGKIVCSVCGKSFSGGHIPIQFYDGYEFACSFECAKED